ncbi:hypothetical protein [Nostoc sp.]|uniref:hypothetical protein n=1 Tax=Nostoc sp. TaxID=1180 RepID=UPI002FF48D63
MSQTVRLQFDNKINPFPETSGLTLRVTLLASLSVRSRQLFYAGKPCTAVLSGGNPNQSGLPYHHTGSLHQKI